MPNEAYLTGEEDVIPNALVIKWKEDTHDPAKQDEREMWVLNPIQFVLHRDAVFSYEEEPEYPEVDR